MLDNLKRILNRFLEIPDQYLKGKTTNQTARQIKLYYAVSWTRKQAGQMGYRLGTRANCHPCSLGQAVV